MDTRDPYEIIAKALELSRKRGASSKRRKAVMLPESLITAVEVLRLRLSMRLRREVDFSEVLALLASLGFAAAFSSEEAMAKFIEDAELYIAASNDAIERLIDEFMERFGSVKT